MDVIATHGLTKAYGRHRGIVDVDLTVHDGEVFGFLGPNGAGKTTTIRTLLGFLRPTSGSAAVFGDDVWRQTIAVKSRLGYVSGEGTLYPQLTGRQVVEMSLHARGRRDEGRLPELAERLGVDLGRRLQQCSHGMRQQVAVVAALAHDPALIILDEPTAGLDPLVKAALWALLAEERARGKTVFLSSHVLSEVQAICDRVGIIREGRLVALEQVSHLRQHRLKRIEADFSTEPPDLSGLPGVREPVVRGHHLSLQVQGDVRPVLAALSSAELHDIEVFDPTLEEVFLQFYTAAEGGPRQ